MRSLPLGERLRSHVVCQEPVSWLGCQLGIKGGGGGVVRTPTTVSNCVLERRFRRKQIK